MTGNSDEMDGKDLAERVCLIEAMLAEGRRKCESWGWTFVLWGVAYYVAFFWSEWGRHSSGLYAWPVTMIAASILTVIGFVRQDNAPNTTMGRAIGAIWMATGVSMFVLFFSLSFSGQMTSPRFFLAAAPAILGLANAACGLTLKWKAEIVCGIVWWVASVIACFGSPSAAINAFLVGIFLCQIVFGIYAMILESRRRSGNGAAHA
jgi:hypothetical protein